VAFLRLAGAFAGGLLMANSAPDLVTAVTGHTDLTPLAGKESSPAVNRVRPLDGGIRGRPPGEHVRRRFRILVCLLTRIVQKFDNEINV
jgi:hypothetical protein